jgi:hypothetical protein
MHPESPPLYDVYVFDVDGGTPTAGLMRMRSSHPCGHTASAPPAIAELTVSTDYLHAGRNLHARRFRPDLQSCNNLPSNLRKATAWDPGSLNQTEASAVARCGVSYSVTK